MTLWKPWKFSRDRRWRTGSRPLLPRKMNRKSCSCRQKIRIVTEWYSIFSGVALTISSYRSVSQTVRSMRVPIITMLFLSAKMKAEHRNMLPCEVLSAALSSRTHRAATSGIRSDFWQRSLRIPCIYLKLLLIYCPMPLIWNARARTTNRKVCFLFRACISQRKRWRTAKSP